MNQNRHLDSTAKMLVVREPTRSTVSWPAASRSATSALVQLYHSGWDHHFNLPAHLPKRCRETDQATAALITDLKQRGLLDDTIVIWGGEFGRTAFSQSGKVAESYGRDITTPIALPKSSPAAGSNPALTTARPMTSLTESSATR